MHQPPVSMRRLHRTPLVHFIIIRINQPLNTTNDSTHRGTCSVALEMAIPYAFVNSKRRPPAVDNRCSPSRRSSEAQSPSILARSSPRGSATDDVELGIFGHESREQVGMHKLRECNCWKAIIATLAVIGVSLCMFSVANVICG
jgi:hypothetical protein